MASQGDIRKYVFLFSEYDVIIAQFGDNWDAVRELLGGKGANLLDATELGIPVPPGFTITTEGCNDYLATDENFPDGLWEQELQAIETLESLTGKRFGDAENPLLVSCRSGAKLSIPGMMDTILNIGLNDDIAANLAARTAKPQFAYDLYRRLVQMFGNVVMNVPDEVFAAVITARRREANARNDAELNAAAWQAVTIRFREIIRSRTGKDFPTDPFDQLRLATEAVFKSWNGKRAIDYREAAGIDHRLGTAVNIQTMVFGNVGDDSATGVCLSRNATTGEAVLEGDYLINAQGEDVVAGTRATLPIAHGLNVSPGAAVGIIAFDPDLAERWAKEEGKDVILVRPETRPDDVHGMLAAKGVVTSKGGRTSHAALVARQFGKPAVVGVEEIVIDLDRRLMSIGENRVIEEGTWLSIDGNHGMIYPVKLPTVVPDIRNPCLLKILSWADDIRELGVLANADYPEDAQRARDYDAETGFLVHYLQNRLLRDNPFTSIDPEGVGRLMRIAIDEGRKAREGLQIGVCGEHGRDPKSIHLCHQFGVNYVSCSPFRVPIARLVAAHAAMNTNPASVTLV